MLKQRLLTVFIVLPVFVAALFLLPNIAWAITILALLLIAAHEWSRLARFSATGQAFFMGTLLLVCAWLLLHMNTTVPPPGRPSAVAERSVFVISLAFWCVLAPSWLWLRPTRLSRPLLFLTGLVLLVPAWLALVMLQRDPWLLLMVLAVVWIADSAAYFAGKTWGRHKLAPAISPGKTWEGVAGALVAVTIYALVLHFGGRVPLPFGVLVAVFLGMTVLSITGDLLESWFKRRAGVKDSGSIFPGHGGMLDRIDAVIAAVPLAAIALIA